VETIFRLQFALSLVSPQERNYPWETLLRKTAIGSTSAMILAHQISSGQYSWKGRKVLVTGGAGFVGSYLVEDLLAHSAVIRVADNFATGSKSNLLPLWNDIDFLECDLRDAASARKAVKGMEVVFHLAAHARGMLFNKSYNTEMFHDNSLMMFQVLHACIEERVERALMVSSSCIYDDDVPNPTPELPVHMGRPESVNEGYGWAKRALEIQSRYIFDQHNLPIAIVRPFNAYGGRYRWQGEASHVVPSLVKKVLDQNGPVVIWGSGQQVRDLLHARDFALGFRLAAECAVDCEPVNLAGGITIQLIELTKKIASLRGLEVEIALDTTKMEGRHRKEADLARLRKKIPAFRPTVSLEAGLQEMFEWYERNKREGFF
jgi:nucleoside-diphosphate-sugar epimerase